MIFKLFIWLNYGLEVVNLLGQYQHASLISSSVLTLELHLIQLQALEPIGIPGYI